MPRSLLDPVSTALQRIRRRAVAGAPSESALAVAALRVAVVGMMLVTNEPREALQSVLVHASWMPPEGLGFLARHAPTSAALYSGVRAVYYSAAALSLIGVYTRVALAALLAAAFVLFGLAQLAGAVLHDMHLLWFLGLLLSSRAGDALSIDEWSRTTPGDGLSRRLLGSDAETPVFGWTLFFARTLLGVIYFFPGLWKLRESGLAWALSDNLAHQMHAKWFEFGIVPSPRIDRAPGFMHAFGLCTIAFELGFLALVHIGPRTRLALAAVGLAFHWGIEHFMEIPFSSLWIAYVVLVPWRCSQPSRVAPGGAGLVTVVGAGLVLANIVQGFRDQTQSYPFACYPTFQWIAPATLVDLELTALLEDGSSRRIPHGRDAAGKRTQSEWGTVWGIAGVYGPPFSVERLGRYIAAERRRGPVERAVAGAYGVRAQLVWWRTDPEAWGQPPVRARELAVIPLSKRPGEAGAP
jgi:hypothetical protein